MSQLDLEELPGDTAWLRRLAHGLARGEPDAEDVAQEAWLVALESEPKGTLRPWLAGVAKNKLRMRRRGEARQRNRETAATAVDQEGAPSAQVLLERAELLRLVARLVMQLDEPVRRALLLRYVDGLSAVQIARLTSEPEGTVRWRLKVGLDRLRAELDQRNDGDRRRWILLLVPAAPRRPIWTHVEATLVVAVVACGALFVANHGRTTDEPVTTASATRSRVTAANHKTQQLDGKASPTIAPPTAVDDPGAPFGAFEGVVLDEVSAEPIANAEITFTRDDAVFTAQTDSTGRFEFAPLHAGHHRVTGMSAPDRVGMTISWNRSNIDLYARPHRRVKGLVLWLGALVEHAGMVVARDGSPVAGATVTVVVDDGTDPELASADGSGVVTNADGRFTLRASPHCVLEARHPQHGRGRFSTLGEKAQEPIIQIAPDALPAFTAQLRGRVIDVGGHPVRNAEVAASGPTILGKSRTDDDGRFTVTGLTASEYFLEVLSTDHVVYTGKHATSDEELVIVMDRAARLSGTVKGPDGSPVTAFVVEVKPPRSLAEPWNYWHTIVDPSGQFSIGNLEPGEYRVIAYAEGYGRSSTLDVDPDKSSAPLTLTLGRGKGLFGRVVDRGGKPIASAVVAPTDVVEERAGMLGAPGSARTGRDGGWSFSSVTADQIKVTAAGFNTRFIATPELVAGKTTGPLIIELSPTAGSAGKIEFAEIGGIGIVPTLSPAGLVIHSVKPGQPAAKAGLVAGDTIITIDGWTVAEEPRAGAGRIRGKVGTAVRLGVRRANGAEIEIELMRRTIPP